MSVFSTFDLDKLVPERFQELCCAILVNNFSQLIEPHGRPGRDKGVDAELIGEAISYGELLNRPLPSKASDGSDLTWIFQVKHIRQDRENDRQRAIIKAFKSEIVAWKKKRGRKPTHFFLLTNINLKLSTKKELKRLGKYFDRFECWGEEKIMSFVLGNVGFQSAFFPGFANLSSEFAKMRMAIEGNQQFISDTSKKAPKKRKVKKATEASFLSSVKTLVDYEVSFLRTNDAFLGQFKFKQGEFKPPKDWIEVVVRSPRNGILVLSEDRKALSDFLGEVLQGNAGVVLWQRYLGEETERDEEVVTLSCHPERVEIVRASTKKLFKVIQGKNTAHLVVDKHLKDLQAKVLSDIKSNRILEAEEGLNDLLAGRREYSIHKKQYPTAFYPNTRTFGRKPIFGWDFSSLWEDVLTSIVEVAFSGTHPQELYRRLIHGPFHLCIEAIRNKLPEERFQAELATTHVIFRVLSEKKDKAHLEQFLDNVDDLAIAVGDIEHQIETKEDAEWAIGISKVVSEYIANLGKLSLSKKVEIPLDPLLPFLHKSTTLRFHNLLEGAKDESASFQDRYALQQHFEQQVGQIRHEYLFALAAYSWFVERKKRNPDPSLAIALLRQIPAQAIVNLYQSKLTRDNGWFGWWFNPEGKRTSWSSRVDHDIRNALQLAILNIEMAPTDLYGLRLLEVESSYNEFTEEVRKLHQDLTSQRHVPSVSIESALKALASARSHLLDVWKDSIRQQTLFSERKLKEIKESFVEQIQKGTTEGALYLVEEGLTEKATHYVGSYSIHDKVWFLEETGYSHYSVMGMGSQWADNILHGREHLLITSASELAIQETYNFNDLETVLNQLKDRGDEDTALLISPTSIPWRYWEKYYLEEYQLTQQGIPPRAGRSGRLGKLDVFYAGRFLKKGEFLLVPKASFVWKVVKRLEAPRLEIIDPSSEIGRKIAEQNPSMDLGLKCLVYAREEGTMLFTGTTETIRLIKPSVVVSNDQA